MIDLSSSVVLIWKEVAADRHFALLASENPEQKRGKEGGGLGAGRDDIQARKEVFSGSEHEYRVRWTPSLASPTAEEQTAGRVVKQVTAVASYRWQNRPVRTTVHGTVEIQLDTTRVRRRLDSKLDSIMGMVPAGLR